MANQSADMNKYPVRAGRGGRVYASMDVSIGASGAATVDYSDDPNFSCAKDGGTAGQYLVVFPASVRASVAVDMISAALTVTHYVWIAWDSGAGTGTLNTLKNDLKAEPASGDKIRFRFAFDSENV